MFYFPDTTGISIGQVAAHLRPDHQSATLSKLILFQGFLIILLFFMKYEEIFILKTEFIAWIIRDRRQVHSIHGWPIIHQIMEYRKFFFGRLNGFNQNIELKCCLNCFGFLPELWSKQISSNLKFHYSCNTHRTRKTYLRFWIHQKP